MFIHSGNFCHEIGDMIRRKSLVSIRLANILIKGNKEQIKQILPGSALVIDKREYVIFNKFQNFSESGNT